MGRYALQIALDGWRAISLASRGVIFFSLFLMFLLAPPAHAIDVSEDWRAGIPTSQQMAFGIYRKGKEEPVGFQVLRFADQPDGSLEVEVYIEIDIYFGPFHVFGYRHHNLETWRDGKLIALSSRTDNNGKDEYVEVAEQAGELVGRGSRYSGTLPTGIIPTSYFNPNFIRQTQILSTQDGRVFEVQIIPRGREQVTTPSGQVAAERFSTKGKVKIDIWYTPQGQWVRTEFERRGLSAALVPVDPASLPPRTQWQIPR